jgi:hypothetical protein
MLTMTCLCATFPTRPLEPWLRYPLTADTRDPTQPRFGGVFGDATADPDGVAVFAIDSDTRLNSISGWSRSSTWRYIPPTAERSSGEDEVQSDARRRTADVNSWYLVSATHRDEGHDHIVGNTGSGEKKTHTSNSMNWLAIINAILLSLSLHTAAGATPPSP